VLEARDHPPSGLALIGWAGGLSPELRAGEVIIARSTMNSRGELRPCKVIPLTNAIEGSILTVPAPALTSQDKSKHQDSGAIAVEMEGYPLAAWAQARGLPFIHARVVLDELDENLPDLESVLDIFGRIYPFKFFIRLLAKPHLIGQLFHLNRRIRILNPSLKDLSRAVTKFWFNQLPMPDA